MNRISDDNKSEVSVERDTQIPCTSTPVVQKRQRSLCSTDASDVEPPAKISRKSPGLPTAEHYTPLDSTPGFHAAAHDVVIPKKVALTHRGGPTELVITYEKEKPAQGTLLGQKLREYDPDGTHFGRYFQHANLALRDLGPCAADLVWREAFGCTDTKSREEDAKHKAQELSQALAMDLVRHWPFKLPNVDVASRNMNVSHKFLRLVQLLEPYQSYGENFRGIIFVQKRVIARLLVDLLRNPMPQLYFLRPFAVTNYRLTSDHDAMETLSHQFISGHFNLLITTKSFEDAGLPKASVVILFDVFESQVSRAYTRGCARGQESFVVHMVQRDNSAHHLTLSRTAFDAEMLQWADVVGHDSLGLMPPKSLHESSDPYASASEDDDDDFIQDPISGSRLRKHHATTSFYRFVSWRANQGGDPSAQELFKYELLHGRGNQKSWQCAIKLPGTPVHDFTGPPSSSKALARREACYSACRQLHHLAYLDSTIFPFQPRPEHCGDNKLCNGAATSHLNPSREQPYVPLSPEFWLNSISRSPLPQFLYPFIVSTTCPRAGLDECTPICILTRSPLPELPSITLFHLSKSIVLQFHRALPVTFNEDRLRLLHEFTVKFCRIFMNKPYESLAAQEMGYFFLPLRRDWRPPMEIDQSLSDVVSDIEWEVVSLVSEKWAVPLPKAGSLTEDLENAVVQDRAVEFTHKCEIIRIREDMTPLSEVGSTPLGYSLLKYAAFATDERFTRGGTTLLEQCHNRRKRFEGLEDPNQPILEVMRMSAATNCLNPRIPSQPEGPGSSMQFLIPEYSRKLTVPASTLRMGSFLPSIMRKIDELLLVKELNTRLGHCVRDDLLMMATTSPLAGYDYDYERLELLGDAFLKYLSSIYVFVQNLNGSEGELHTARQTYISNQQLCYAASQFGLPGYIQLKPFNIKSWVPPGLKISDVQKKDTAAVGEKEAESDGATSPNLTSQKQTDVALDDRRSAKRPKGRGKKRPKKSALPSPISNKTVADVAEAIIGAAYISGGREAALKATKALMIPMIEIEEWSDFDRKARMPHPNCQLDPYVIGSVERIICHQFKKPHLLALALTHTTLNSLEMKSHQRFEFIGDAVLDFLVVRYLYGKYQQSSPGDLSLLKSIMVSNSALAAVCVQSGLHKFTRVTQQLGHIIQIYEKALTTQQAVEYSQAEREGRSVSQYWKDLDAPKALSDVVESIIGAIFISDSFTPIGAEAFFNNVLKPFYDKYIPSQTPNT